MTCGGERSGRASSGVFLIDQMEPSTIKSDDISTKKRFFTEKAMSFSIMIHLSMLRLGVW